MRLNAAHIFAACAVKRAHYVVNPLIAERLAIQIELANAIYLVDRLPLEGVRKEHLGDCIVEFARIRRAGLRRMNEAGEFGMKEVVNEGPTRGFYIRHVKTLTFLNSSRATK